MCYNKDVKEILANLTDDELKSLLNKHQSIRGLILSFGLSPHGQWYKLVKARIIKGDIVYTRSKKSLHLKKPMSDILINKSNYDRGDLKKRLIKEKYLENKCSICELEAQWQGRSLVMVLDHINGYYNDNRLKNLRLLCPNCNSQIPTFAGGNKKRKRASCCEECGSTVYRNSRRCSKCHVKYMRCCLKSKKLGL